MRRGKALAALAAAGGAALVLVRSRSRRVERVDLYAEDGSVVTLEPGSADAARLLPLARELVGL
jgi:hypothetical protein